MSNKTEAVECDRPDKVARLLQLNALGDNGSGLNHALAVNMTVAANAPDSCQSDLVSWTATVQMVTLGN